MRNYEQAEAARQIAALSWRERQVLDRIVAGRLTEEIAHDLGISGRTVEVHRSRMLDRLRTRSTAGAAVRLAVLANLAPANVGVVRPSKLSRKRDEASDTGDRRTMHRVAPSIRLALLRIRLTLSFPRNSQQTALVNREARNCWQDRGG